MCSYFIVLARLLVLKNKSDVWDQRAVCKPTFIINLLTPELNLMKFGMYVCIMAREPIVYMYVYVVSIILFRMFKNSAFVLASDRLFVIMPTYCIMRLLVSYQNSIHRNCLIRGVYCNFFITPYYCFILRNKWDGVGVETRHIPAYPVQLHCSRTVELPCDNVLLYEATFRWSVVNALCLLPLFIDGITFDRVSRNRQFGSAKV